MVGQDEPVTAAQLDAAYDAGTLPPCEPGSAEWADRLVAFLTDDRPPMWWWLSFVDTTLPYTEEGNYPGGPRWIGVCIVPASNMVEAAHVAHLMGCNPGGQVTGYGFELADGYRLKAEYVGRLFAGDAGLALAELDLEEMVVHE